MRAKWLQEYLDHQWDKQLEIDLKSERPDRLIAQAVADIENPPNSQRSLW